MDAFSSATASRRLWSKAPGKKRVDTHLHRKESAVTLPVLARRPNGQHSKSPARNTSLHAFLASQLENNERENYSRSQLRAMASSKLQSTSNNHIAARIHSSAERLAPLDPTTFEKSRPQRRPLPGPLESAINEVLAVTSSSQVLSERGESRDDSNNDDDNEPETLVVPTCKRVSPCKLQLQSRRPEWQRYIRRITMTKGIRGSTLARYRRLVGIVARRNLTHSYAGAAERVVRYRLEFRSAVIIQALTLRFIHQRRQAKQLQRHQAATTIQRVCRRVLAVERQRKLAEIERLRRISATRSLQRCYRKYRVHCRLREEQQRQLKHATLLQKARLKLLRRYQSWRQSSKRDEIDPKPEESSNGMRDNVVTSSSCSRETSESCTNTPRDLVEAVGTCAAFVRNDLATAETPRGTTELIEDSVDHTTKDSPPIKQTVSENNALVLLDDEGSPCKGDADALPQVDLPTEKHECSAVSATLDENQSTAARNDFQLDSFQPLRSQTNTLESFSPPKAIDEASSVTKTEPEEDTESWDNNASADADEVEAATVFSELLADDLQQNRSTPADVGNEVSELELEVSIVTTAMFRAAAAKRIACFLLPKLQARHALKTHAAIQIQCLARLYLARQCLAHVRLEVLQSLRAQLLASWHSVVQEEEENGNEGRVQHAAFDHCDEDDELELETQGHQTTLDPVSENYIHLLPTRNGQIPPGVPLLTSSAGAPLLALWKWSWPDERWLSTGQ
ncbi:hypothetical protein PF008_g26366 [Phytophthora fragariae]|uniref:Uncharacterized protein n=1 Tax=Phytophthora fragariae TaxID=53985 RepID=A0A6G0QH94_9STRA|nr:hypothetical protein PF008_g26366 [Phytophthora fragariae]